MIGLLLVLALDRFAALVYPSAPWPMSDGYSLSADLTAAQWLWDDAGSYSYMGDVDGRFVHVRNRSRLTVGQPEHYAHSLYLFGNSLAFDYGVDDAHTLASRLQARLRAYRVVNMGGAGNGAVQALSRLRQTALEGGDIVLFYTSATAVLTTDYAMRAHHAELRFCDEATKYLWSLSLLRLGCHLGKAGLLADLAHASLDGDYERYTRAAYAYARERGATFYNVVQPEYWLIVDPCLLCLRSVPLADELEVVTQATLPALHLRGVPEIDLTGVLHHAADFADLGHMSERGDDALAQAVYDALTVY